MIYRKVFLNLIILCLPIFQVKADTCDQSLPFKNVIEAIDKASCSELPIGKSVVANFDRTNSPTTVSHKYELLKTASDKYKVRLNLRFQENTLLARENTEITKKMRDKIQKCLEWINPHLLGPDNKKLELELIDPTESKIKKYDEITNWITVSEKKIPRENSGFYSLQTSCPVIAHELLHLLGLVDEYKEPIDIPWYEQDCRSLGPPDSIMANHEEATDFNNEFPQKMFVSCCVCKDNSCKNISESDVRSLKACPTGYDMISMYLKSTKEGASLGQSGNYMLCSSMGKGFMGMNEQKNSFLLSTRPSGRIKGSFLYPAQFRSIISPGCKDKNRTYYSCSRDSYFRPYKLVGHCNSKPKECQNHEDWLK